MYADYHITMESFGADLPQNWEEIAAYLNGMIDERLNDAEQAFDPSYDATGLSAEGHEIVNGIWESFCTGEIKDAPLPIF